MQCTKVKIREEARGVFLSTVRLLEGGSVEDKIIALTYLEKKGQDIRIVQGEKKVGDCTLGGGGGRENCDE